MAKSGDILTTSVRVGHCPKCEAILEDPTKYPELDFSEWCPVCGWESETAEEMTKRRGPKNYISYMGEDRY